MMYSCVLATLSVVCCLLIVLAILPQLRAVCNSLPNEKQLTSLDYLVTHFIVIVPQEMLIIALCFLLCLCATCTTLAYLLNKSVLPRLRLLMTAAEHWMRRDFSFTIQDEADDEVAALSSCLNSMIRQLDKDFAERQRIAVLEERNALARDLHDGVKQLVFALAAQVQIAKEVSPQSHPAQPYLQEAMLLLQSIQEEMNNLIQHLRPTVLREKGLKHAIQDHLQNWSRRHSIRTTFISDLQHTEDAVSLLPEQEEALFRLMQEALSNVARHSKAKHVEVRLSSDSQETVLRVIDDGHGFERAQVVPGVGLHSMEERLQACGGTVEIRSVPDQGTTVVATLKQSSQTNPFSLNLRSERPCVVPNQFALSTPR
jgi:NarL family two-component system sensor histidine kinase LiaS